MLISDLLDSMVPVIQAPMAGVQDSALALAVSSAGGLGSLPCAMLDEASLRSELDKLRASGDRPINMNFFCHAPPVPDREREARWRARLQPYFAEYGIKSDEIPDGAGRRPFSHEIADVLEEYRPAVISFHFGLPAPDLLQRVKAWGTSVLSTATTVDEACWLEAHGADAVIAQGLEAGGHRGMFLTKDLTTQAGTFALLPQVLRAVDVPVIAAGGIADGRGVAAVLSLGAVAAQVGTGYLLCRETKTTPLHRAALKSHGARHTAVTNVFSGRPARGIVNRIIGELGPICPDAPDFPLAATAVTALRERAEAAGSTDFTPLWSGQNASGCREISAREFTGQLVAYL
ncbi:MAG: nitronate monooxygenase [Gammaproteobacteria bacterium]|jgi:nitronate monooxygenase